MQFPIYSIDDAPQAARPILQRAEDSYGFVPNLWGVMAGAPALLEAYATIYRLFEGASLSATERQIVLLTVSYENTCGYCMAAHTVVAGMQKVPEDVVDAIRRGRPLDDPKLEALRRFTRVVTLRRGLPSDEHLSALNEAGYGARHVLEILLGVGMKTLSNYTNHLADTPVDEGFAASSWSADETVSASTATDETKPTA